MWAAAMTAVAVAATVVVSGGGSYPAVKSHAELTMFEHPSGEKEKGFSSLSVGMEPWTLVSYLLFRKEIFIRL